MSEGAVLVRALAFIRREEELRLVRYRCPAGYWTIGYGHRCGEDQPEITVEEAEAFLRADVLPSFEVVKALPGLSDDQRVALVSFVFNVGRGAFISSTMRRKLAAGDMAGVGIEFMRWVYIRSGSGMVVSPGLEARRARERLLFLGVKNGLAEKTGG